MKSTPRPSRSTQRRGAAARQMHRDALSIATHAPRVVSLRLAGMARHGLLPNARERAELHRMSSEKVHAFGEAWAAMGWQVLRVQQAMWSAWIGSLNAAWPTSFTGRKPFGPTMLGRAGRRQAQTLTEGFAQVAAAGLAPVRKRVAGNARRLGRNGR